MSARSYRLSPRRSGGRSTRIHWDRLGRIVLVFVLFAIVFSYISPLVNFIDAWQGSHATESQLQTLQREHERLAAKAASLDDPSVAVTQARKMGMVLPGERSYVVKKLQH